MEKQVNVAIPTLIKPSITTRPKFDANWCDRGEYSINTSNKWGLCGSSPVQPAPKSRCRTKRRSLRQYLRRTKEWGEHNICDVVIGTSRTRLDFRCIEDRFRLGPARLARRWKAASQYGMTHNAGIFPLKNHSIAPATHLGFHNPYTEIHKVAWIEGNFESR